MYRNTAIAALLLLGMPSIAIAAPTAPACQTMTDAQVGSIADQILTAVDTNHDGMITRDEIAAFGMKNGGMTMIRSDRWKTADADGNGKLNRAEVVGYIATMAKDACPRVASR